MRRGKQGSSRSAGFCGPGRSRDQARAHLRRTQHAASGSAWPPPSERAPGTLRLYARKKNSSVHGYRSHFGSRYTLGCCGHASLFCAGSIPAAFTLLQQQGKLCAVTSGLFLPSSTFGSCHRGCPIRPSLQHSMPNTECHWMLDFLVANLACSYHCVICWCRQRSKNNFFTTIQF